MFKIKIIILFLAPIVFSSMLLPSCQFSSKPVEMKDYLGRDINDVHLQNLLSSIEGEPKIETHGGEIQKKVMESLAGGQVIFHPERSDSYIYTDGTEFHFSVDSLTSITLDFQNPKKKVILPDCYNNLKTQGELEQLLGKPDKYYVNYSESLSSIYFKHSMSVDFGGLDSLDSSNPIKEICYRRLKQPNQDIL